MYLFFLYFKNDLERVNEIKNNKKFSELHTLLSHLPNSGLRVFGL